MKHYGIKNIEHEFVAETTCDKCGEKITIDRFDAFEFELKYKTGNIYPDSGWGEETTLDLCDDCSKKLLDLINEHGFKTNIKKWDF